MRSPVIQFSVSLFKEEFELFLDPGDHLVVLVQNSALTEQQGKSGVLVCNYLRFTGEGFIDGFEWLLKLSLQFLLRVFFIAEQVVEEDDGCVEDNLWIAAREAPATELDQIPASL